MTATDGWTVDVLDDLTAVRALVPEWSDLADACDAGPLSLPGFLLPWWEHLGRGRLHVITVRRAGTLVGLAPLHTRSRGRLEIVRWLGHGLGTVAELLIRPGHESAATRIWAELSGDRGRVLDLVEYRHGGGGLLELRRAGSWQSHCSLHETCLIVDLDGAESADRLIGARRNLRRQLARGQREIDEACLVHGVETATTVDQLSAVLPDMIAVQAAADADGSRVNLLAPPWREFTVSVLQRAAAEQRLMVHLGRLSGRPASFNVAFRTGDTMSNWLARVEPWARAFSPGHHLLQRIIADAGGAGLRRMDMLVGDDEYKRRWATGSYDTASVLAATPGLLPAARTAVSGIAAAHRLRSLVNGSVGQWPILRAAR